MAITNDVLFDNDFTKTLVKNQPRLRNQTLNVDNDLRKYSLNRYVNRNQNRNVVGTDDPDKDDEELQMDDLLLTNAISEDIVQDKIDKTRYLKETKSFININSASRNLSNRTILLDKNQPLNNKGVMQSTVKTLGVLDVFPNPNNYQVFLNKSYTNVKSIRIISSEIPNTNTIINLNNNEIKLSFKHVSTQISTKSGNEIWNIFIPPGNYNVEELSTEIQSTVNNLIDQETSGEYKNVFEIIADQKKNIFEITSIEEYTFIWEFIVDKNINNRYLYEILGFQTNKKEIYGNSFNNLVDQLGQLIPFNSITLQNCNYIWMKIKDFNYIFDTLTQDFYFSKFNFKDVDFNEIAYDTFVPTAKIFDVTPLPHLIELKISFFDEFGDPLDFNGKDNSFTLEIVHHMDRLMGNDYSSRRGTTDKTSYI